MTKAERSKMEAEEAKWRAEDDLRTLMKAEEIKKDSKRLAAAKKIAKEKADEMKTVLGGNKVFKQ